MKERPILFSAPMVRAILAGQKTQTRRVINPQPLDDGRKIVIWWPGGKGWDMAMFNVVQSRWNVGDHLWVREGFEYATDRAGNEVVRYKATPEIISLYDPGTMGVYWSGKATAKDIDESDLVWSSRPSIHMPRWASRITLEVTAVRVERLQDISITDAIAEGAPIYDDSPHQTHAVLTWYAELWDAINGDGAWAANPYVWVLEFKRV